MNSSCVNSSVANGTPVPVETDPWTDAGWWTFDPVMVVATVLAMACCVGGLVSILLVVHKHLEGSSNNHGSNSNGNGDGSSQMSRVFSRLPRNTLAIMVPCRSQKEKAAVSAVRAAWLLNDDASPERSPIYRPVTEPLAPHHVV